MGGRGRAAPVGLGAGDLGELAGALEVRLVLAFGLGLGAPVRSARGGA
ncbi:hypothetical protein [Polyangium jinanense]|uniref:Uncharacterized protein n=1 Tax=Polyangium jinanense TaxID=2829994 RepID=A0A9X3XBQ2_9BACT|nr:hypothetical protein [Polyangium jinanense]MDC3987699.1 hypothetical protein [Polyangium jinanense]